MIRDIIRSHIRRGLNKEAAALVSLLVKSAQGFDFNHLKAIDDADELNGYAHRHLKFLGMGSSRAAYMLPDNKVLKIAIDESGKAQNKLEALISNDKDVSQVVASVFEHDDNYRWIVSELIVQQSTAQSFSDYAGTYLEDIEQIGDYEIEELPHPEFVKQFKKLMTKYSLLAGDFYNYQHWGMTASGRLVIFDYGLNLDIYKDYYDSDRRILTDWVKLIRKVNALDKAQMVQYMPELTHYAKKGYPAQKIALTFLKNLPSEILNILADSPSPEVRRAVISHKNVTREILKKFVNDDDISLLYFVIEDEDISPKDIETIYNNVRSKADDEVKSDFMKSLLLNDKTPEHIKEDISRQYFE